MKTVRIRWQWIFLTRYPDGVYLFKVNNRNIPPLIVWLETLNGVLLYITEDILSKIIEVKLVDSHFERFFAEINIRSKKMNSTLFIQYQ